MLFSVNTVGRDGGKLECVHRLADVAAAAERDFFGTAVLQCNRDPLLLREHGSRTGYGSCYLLGLDGLELKDRGTAENRVIYIKIRILGGGCDQRDAAVFDILEQRLLLLLVEILDLVEIEQDAVEPFKGIELCDDRLDIGSGSGGAVELFEGFVCLFRDIGRERRLADARGTVEYQIGNRAALDDFPQRLSLPEQVLLTDDIVETLRTETVSQRFEHIITS